MKNPLVRRCRIRRAIIDRHVNLPEGTVIGFDPDADRARYSVSEGGGGGGTYPPPPPPQADKNRLRLKRTLNPMAPSRIIASFLVTCFFGALTLALC
jgi:hypothetical protein